MSDKFLSGGIIKQCKEKLDKVSIMPGEMYMTEDQYRTLGKMVGWTEEEIEEGLKNSGSILVNEIE